MRSILLICSALMLVFGVNAKNLNFSEYEWDFGTIAEDGGNVSHNFTLQNDGSTPIIIYSLSTSCGCTTTEYSRKPILKGEQRDLKIEFDPMYRPGNFVKSILVYTSQSKEPTTLKIKGRVTPRVLPIEERYPYKLVDDVRIGSLFVSFRAVPHGRLVQQVVELRNMSDRARRIEFKPRTTGTPLQIYYVGDVKPNGEQSLEVGYYVEGGRGRLADTLDVYVDGRKIDKYISIKGLIVE